MGSPKLFKKRAYISEKSNHIQPQNPARLQQLSANGLYWIADGDAKKFNNAREARDIRSPIPIHPVFLIYCIPSVMPSNHWL
jgi:hypothetical protein